MCSTIIATAVAVGGVPAAAAAARFICFEAQKIFKLQILMKWLETMEHLTAHNKIMLQHNNNISIHTTHTHTPHTHLMPWKFLSISFVLFLF